MLRKHQDPKARPRKVLSSTDKPFKGMMISLAGRLTRTHVCIVVSSAASIVLLLELCSKKKWCMF